MSPSLTVVIPAYNEEIALVSVLPRVLNYCRERSWKLIIINDGSTDRTGDVLRQYEGDPSIKIIHHKLNRGYGAALKTGILAVESPYLVTLDADGQHQLDDIDHMQKELVQHNADMIIGSRVNQRSSNLYIGLGKSIIRAIARVLVPNEIYDLNSGMKLYRTELAKSYSALCPDSMAFSDTITLIFVYERNLVIERPITVNKRIGGHSTINTLTAANTVIEMFNMLMLFNPIRLLAPIALVTFMLGLVWSIPFILLGRGLSVAALLLMINGSVIFTFGLVAQQLSLIRKERFIRVTTTSGHGDGGDGV
jgi:glycosyltransferase involved in cell wall biosynthesis